MRSIVLLSGSEYAILLSSTPTDALPPSILSSVDKSQYAPGALDKSFVELGLQSMVYNIGFIPPRSLSKSEELILFNQLSNAANCSISDVPSKSPVNASFKITPPGI